jgi:hypothetical protein
VTVDPLDIKCTECNAKPREQCGSMVIASHIREVPHYVRIEAARLLSMQPQSEGDLCR